MTGGRRTDATEGPAGRAKAPAADAPPPEVTARQVEAWLRANPDFLARNPALLTALTPPARAMGRNVVDLQHMMMRRLQESVAALEAQRRSLIAGGRARHGLIDIYPQPVPETHIDVPRKRIQQVLGIDLPTSEVRAALTALGFGCRWSPPSLYQVRVPYWRNDVRIPDDVAEEVARIVGYDQIPTKGLGGDVPPAVPQPRRELRERLRDALVAAGMQEVITYSLTTMAALERVMPPEELATHPPLRAVNPVSADHESLRPLLRAGLLRVLGQNVRRSEGELALFEAARVYLAQPDDVPQEQEHIVGVVTGWREKVSKIVVPRARRIKGCAPSPVATSITISSGQSETGGEHRVDTSRDDAIADPASVVIIAGSVTRPRSCRRRAARF